jgi:nucleoid DNA-binding protein
VSGGELTRTELVAIVAAAHDMPRREAREAVDSVLDFVREALCRGERIELRGLGTLRPRHRPSHPGMDPRTGCAIEVPDKVYPAYRQARSLLPASPDLKDHP